MAAVDIFNGDADGICALVQLRLAEPKESRLVTGVKRDISLVAKADIQSGDQVTVLDISYDKNRDGVDQALKVGAEIFYVDHHFAGDINPSSQLTTHINTDADVCTSLLLNGYLKGAHLAWAVAGAFGDNLRNSARTAAKPLELSEEQLAELEHLGILLNYNGYGSDLVDLHFHPAELYKAASQYASPFEFMQDGKETYGKLANGYANDMASAQALKPHHQTKAAAVYTLPNEPWARRVSGVYSNDLANASPELAHAVLTEKANGNYLISVRAPLNNKTGADEICRQFATGGGRAAAAGVNDLPADQLAAFIDTLNRQYS